MRDAPGIASCSRDRPPVASNLQLESSRQAPISSRLIGSDDDDDVLTFRLVTQPANGTVTYDPATGTFTYSPDPDPAHRGGTDRFTYVANDGITDSKAATVRIDMTDNTPKQ